MGLEYMTGWELGTAALEDTSMAFSSVGTDAAAHKDSAGNGGSYVLKASFGVADTAVLPLFRNAIEAGRIGVFLRHQGVGNLTIWWRDGSTDLGRVRFDFAAQTVAIYTGSGAGTLRDSAALAMSASTWHNAEIEIDLDNTTGALRLFFNDSGDYATPILEFTGDTQPGAEVSFNRLAITQEAANGGVWVDEVTVHSITVEYDGGTGGAAALGDTVTGTTSGATGIVTLISGNATAGTLWLRATSGVWQNNEAITTTAGAGTLNALIDAPDAGYIEGYAPNSAFPGTRFIVFLRPGGNGTTSGLTGSDGNSVDNYLLVDEQPMTSADYVEADADDEFDTYAMQDLPATAVSILAVEGVVYGSKDGSVINNMQHAVRTGGTNYFTSSYALPGTDGVMKHTWVESPNTGVPWTPANINAVEAGVKFKV